MNILRPALVVLVGCWADNTKETHTMEMAEPEIGEAVWVIKEIEEMLVVLLEVL